MALGHYDIVHRLSSTFNTNNLYIATYARYVLFIVNTIHLIYVKFSVIRCSFSITSSLVCSSQMPTGFLFFLFFFVVKVQQEALFF